ncbi:hypothetical protein niasHT_015991 [Heterodera trifolii]|uniref:Peptidase S1 domain-containing protein n=1 Tax=Heterodera trifolii TaxID=157864 RepID=A0ABD2L1L9_9BILA
MGRLELKGEGARAKANWGVKKKWTSHRFRANGARGNAKRDQIVIAYGASNLKQLQKQTGVTAVKLHPKGTAALRNQINDAKADKNIVINGNELEHNEYDMAIIKLKKPIAFTANAHPICLIEYGSNNHSTFIVAGWGLTSPYCLKDSKTGPSNQLMYGKMKISPPENCQSASIKKSKRISIDDDDDDGKASNDNKHAQIICVEPGPSVIESGDSGGPLMRKIGKNNWVQVGVASAGTCNPEKPESTDGNTSQYAQIDCNWIEEATNGEVKCIIESERSL